MSAAEIVEEQARELRFVAGELDQTMRRAPLNATQTRLVQRDMERFGAVEGLYAGSASCPVGVARMSAALVDDTVMRDLGATGPATSDEIDQNATDLDRLRFTATTIERDLQANPAPTAG